MTIKLLKTIKLALALSSAIIFFIFLFAENNEFNLYIGLHNFYFSLGLITVLILVITNYFSANEKYNIVTNTLALFMAVSFAFKLFTETDWFFYSNSYANVFLGLLLPVMLVAIFMLENFKLKQINKKLSFQLGIIIFIFLFYLIALGNETATTLFIVLLFCTFYIMASAQQFKSAGWLKIILYSILAYYLYSFFASLPTEIHVIKIWHPDVAFSQLIQWIYGDYFWDLLIIGILAFVLIINKPAQDSLWLKKLISKFR